MVYLSIRFLFSAFYLSTCASYLMASKCCPGDTTCSRCWMCIGSDLRSCWDEAVPEIEACDQISDDSIMEKLSCMCNGHARLAYCWKSGRCCSEFSPTLAAAANLCNLLTHPPHQISKDLVHKASRDALVVRNTIYHNDRGTDVPKLSVYIKASSYDFSVSASYHTQNLSPQSDYTKNYLIDYTSNTTNENPQRKDNTNYNSKSETQNLEHKNISSKLQITTSPDQTQAHQDTSRGSPNKIHHQAKCSRSQHKCQTQVASQYQKARRQTSSQSLAKRGPLSQPEASLPNNAEIWKRSDSECGLDFQGVLYPTDIPESVAKVFAKFSE